MWPEHQILWYHLPLDELSLGSLWLFQVIWVTQVSLVDWWVLSTAMQHTCAVVSYPTLEFPYRFHTAINTYVCSKFSLSSNCHHAIVLWLCVVKALIARSCSNHCVHNNTVHCCVYVLLSSQIHHIPCRGLIKMVGIFYPSSVAQFWCVAMCLGSTHGPVQFLSNNYSYMYMLVCNVL